MDTFGAMIVLTLVVMSMVVSAIFISNDYRHFNQVVKQCTERGYIQNDHVRILCKPENKE